MHTPEIIRALVEFTEGHELYLLSDEIYEGFVYERIHVPDAVVSILGSAGVLAAIPRGAFYALVALPLGDANESVAFKLLAEERVGTAPGETFDGRAHGMVRISFATAPEILEERLRRIVRFARRRAAGTGVRATRWLGKQNPGEDAGI